MTVEAKDINQNPVGSATYTSTGSHDWENKSVSLTATGPVSYVTVSFSGIDNGFWYGTYGPHFKNPTLQISHGQMVTETTYEEVITYEEETYYTYETYYTTELVTTEGTLNVKINEGGEATFNAPEGAVFVSSNLRYEAIARPTCGKDIQPNINGLSTVTIKALNSVWGDPCGGWQKHVTGTLTYLGQPTAPLIKDPAKLITLNEATEAFNDANTLHQENQAAYDAKLSTKQAADLSLDAAQLSFDEAESNKEELTTQLASENLELQRLTTLNETAQGEFVQANGDVTQATAELNQASQDVTMASSEVSAAELDLATKTNDLNINTVLLDEASLKVTEGKDTLTSKDAALAKLYTDTEAEVSSIERDMTFAETDRVPVPVPEPPVEEGSKEIPAELTAENLLEVDLDKVDPTELTEAQAEQLVEAALETFETAEAGSPEYEQALDALYLAAEQDDIVLSEELAAIPGLAGAVEVLNFLGNAGADMSPKVREESEKIVVTAVVAAGAAVQAAAGAAASAASSASAPSGGSRRVGK
jgi:hypothetical protein